MKNKKSLKNLKQYRVRSKFVFYVVFRPIAQKLFFPVMAVILVLGILDHEYGKKWSEDRWTFINETNTETVDSFVKDSASQGEANKSHDGVPVSSTVETKTMGGAEPVAPQVAVIKEVAEKAGISWKILYAICKKESNCNPNRVGDSGNSYGAFQIHQKYHPGTIECAKDLKCSAEWTAKRLKRHANLGEWKMIQSHNGLLASNVNAYYVEDVLKIIQSL